jgi:exonuclease III
VGRRKKLTTSKKLKLILTIIVGLFYFAVDFIKDKLTVDDRNTIVVANWNVQNLFDNKNDGREYEKFVPNKHNWTTYIYKKKIKNISKVICDLDADVLGLEEIESKKALDDLQKYLKRVGCEYKYSAITSSKKTPIHTALLSKIPIKSKKDIKVTKSALYRSILEVTLNTTPPLKIFVNHWSSKMHPESKRIVYAKTLRKRLDKLPKDAEYIIIGDFNSNYNEFKVMPDKLNDTNGKTGINHVLGTIIGDDFVRLSYLKNTKNSKKLYNLWLELPKEKRWSYKYYKNLYSLDSIIIPRTLVDGKNWEYVKGSFNVFRPKYLFTKRGSIFKWQYKHGKHLGKGYSDHLPIYAKFKKIQSKENKKKNSDQKLPKTSFLNQGSNFGVDIQKEKKKVSIKDLIKKNTLFPAILEDVAVTLKRGKAAIVQDLKNKDGILIYGGANELRVGRVYDLEIFKIKDYYQMPEIIDFEIKAKKRKINLKKFIENFSPSLMSEDLPISKVVKNIKGVVNGNKIIINKEAFQIYFKGRQKPQNGSKLMIKIAQIGYYKGKKEIIVWSKKDYSILD